MTQTTLTKADLRQFSGSENWYRHSLERKVLYTDGAKYVAEVGGAYWLLDEIVFAQAKAFIADEKFQLWHLSVKADKTAILCCEDGDCMMVYAKQIHYTDFPLEEITFYFTNNVIMLPSEY